jgi:hypothetical protein
VGILSVHLFIAHFCKKYIYYCSCNFVVSFCFACSSAIMVVAYSCILEVLVLFETGLYLSHETFTTCVNINIFNSDHFLGIMTCYSGFHFYGKLSKTKINHGELDLR